jgi:glycosyltransferase involved in cell wall biosynthesis
LYVGRIDERKGVTDAVASLAELPGEAVLTVVGGGSAGEIGSLRSQAAALGLTERVRIVGMRPAAELRAHYEAADAVLFPVRWEEPWGLVPLEAMGMGRPVVATGRGGSGEFLRDGENCVLADAEDPGALARALRRLADDRTLRSRLRVGGQHTAELHTAPAFNEQVVRHLRRAVLACAGQ